MKIGFDNQKYLSMQSEHIRERINQFDNKLYLEFGGKLNKSHPFLLFQGQNLLIF